MRIHNLTVVVVVFLFLLSPLGGKQAEALPIVSEQFSGVGVPSGWVADSNVSFDGNVAILQGQTVPTDVSLSTTIDLTPAGAYTLSFDVYFANQDQRGIGPVGQLNYFEASFVSDDYLKYAMFMGYDKDGPYNADNTNFVPGAVSGWYHFSQDITALAGGRGTLYFDLYDRGDQYVSVAKLDNVQVDWAAAPVPEPSSMVLLLAGTCGLVCLRRWRN